MTDDNHNPLAGLGDMLQRTMRTIRDETERKVRQREFRERMSPEEWRRAEESLARFKEYMAPFCGDEDEWEES